MSLSCAPPETVYIKLNPCCILIKDIRECEDIGDSLPTIQFNFENLNAHVCDLELSATQIWDPTYTLVREASALWQNAASLVNQYASAWNNAWATVNAYSAAWLEPITVVYPTPVPFGGSVNVATILSWITTNFPISTAPAANSQCSVINHPAGQRMWVFVGKLTRAVQLIVATSNCTPVFNSALIRSYNTTINFGAGAYSATGWVGIGGSVTSGTGAFLGIATLLAINISAPPVGLSGSYTDQYTSGYAAIEYIVNGSGAWVYNQTLWS
jgi:hypothetical protein